MIGHLTGTVSRRGDKGVVLDVNGVGYRVWVTLEKLKQLKAGAKATLYTHLAVRENALDLYGFGEPRELEFFELLLSVSGIGPKSALGILSLAPPETLEKAILAADAAYLTKVSGVGKKSAEKIVLELKDKLGGLARGGGAELQTEAETVEALQALGYTLAEARAALKNVPASVGDAGERIKLALRQLGK